MTVPYGWLVVKIGQHGKEERKTGIVGRLQGHQQFKMNYSSKAEMYIYIYIYQP
jgi:uncharacterized membrane protein (DUF106 family)